MKADKQKIVFVGIVLLVLAFIIIYSLLVFNQNENEVVETRMTLVPELEEEPQFFSSKKEALDAIKEKRETPIPSMYDETFLDSTGQFDPSLIEKEKQRVVDSIYKELELHYTSRNTTKSINLLRNTSMGSRVTSPTKKHTQMNSEESSFEQQLFFASNPQMDNSIKEGGILVEVDGEQIVRANDRIQMRVVEPSQIQGITIAQNTLLYGLVRFKPNRVLLEIDNIDQISVSLKAYDLQDGLEGIYIKNSFKTEVQQEVTEDVIGDINVPGVPQVKGLNRVFRRQNRNVKVTVNDHYRLILK